MMAQDLILKLQALVDKHGDVETTVIPSYGDITAVKWDAEDDWITIEYK